MCDPALSAEEWADALAILAVTERPEGLHGAAAIALHGQPFGFTREDVEALRAIGGTDSRERFFGNLADRIEALLPPEGS